MTLRELHEETPEQAAVRQRAELEARLAYWQEQLRLEHEMAAARMRLESREALIPIIACFIVAGTAAVWLWF